MEVGEMKMVAMKEYGCFVKVEDGALFYVPMLIDGTPDLDEEGEPDWCEVTAPENQDYLDAINAIYGTTFRYEGFAGR